MIYQNPDPNVSMSTQILVFIYHIIGKKKYVTYWYQILLNCVNYAKICGTFEILKLWFVDILQNLSDMISGAKKQLYNYLYQLESY